MQVYTIFIKMYKNIVPKIVLANIKIIKKKLISAKVI